MLVKDLFQECQLKSSVNTRKPEAPV